MNTAHVSGDVSHTFRRREKNTSSLQMLARLCILDALQRYVCIAESARRIKWTGVRRDCGREEGGGWRVRRARVDVKNEPTRCERIDELALLKRACIRAAEMKEEKKRERVTFVNVQPRSPSSSASIKLLFPLVVRSSSLFSFFCFFLHLLRNFTSPENTLRKVVSGLTRTMASARGET